MRKTRNKITSTCSWGSPRGEKRAEVACLSSTPQVGTAHTVAHFLVRLSLLVFLVHTLSLLVFLLPSSLFRSFLVFLQQGSTCAGREIDPSHGKTAQCVHRAPTQMERLLMFKNYNYVQNKCNNVH